VWCLAKFTYPEAKYFKELIDALGKLVDEVAFQLKPEGLKVVALDPAKVALLSIDIPATAFLEYNVEEEAVAGLSTANLAKLLKKIKRGDKFVLTVVEDKVEVVIESLGRRIYRFRNLEVPTPEIPEAQLEFNVKAMLLVDVIKQALKDAETVGEILEIEAPDDRTLYLRGVGATVAETKLVAGMPALLSLEVKEPSKAKYQLEYLKHVVGITKIAEVATLAFSSDAPLQLEFRFGDARVTYLLAPTA